MKTTKKWCGKIKKGGVNIIYIIKVVAIEPKRRRNVAAKLGWKDIDGP